MGPRLCRRGDGVNGETLKRRVDVGCALILKAGQLLISQRKPGSNFAGYWEFPGGKREPGESLEDCLVREVLEELGVFIRPRKKIRQDEHVLPDRVLDLHFYVCDWVSGSPSRRDCHDFRWTAPEELRRYRFPPADRALIHALAVQKKFLLEGCR